MKKIFLIKIAIGVLLTTLLLHNYSFGQGEKHALLVVGDESLVWHELWGAKTSLWVTDYIVHEIQPLTSATIMAKIAELGAISRDPNLPDWDQFIFYFVGHGGSGFMTLNNSKGTINNFMDTQILSLAIFTQIWVDATTYIFDMCDAESAVPFVKNAASQSQEDPAGWILGACEINKSTYGEDFSEALAYSLATLGAFAC